MRRLRAVWNDKQEPYNGLFFIACNTARETNNERRIEMKMNMNTVQGEKAFGGMAGRAGLPLAPEKPGKTMAVGGELVTLLKDGVKSGDADAGVPEEIERLVVAGAGPEELMDTLRKAVEKGRISPLLLARAEKLLGMGPGADELTDRAQVVRGNRNKLLL